MKQQTSSLLALIITAATAFTAPSKSAAQDAQQKPLTKEECRAVAAVYVEVVKRRQTSEDFRNSMIAWVKPGAFTCDGPTNIVIRTGNDSDVFVTIRDALGAGPKPINIMSRAGLRAVAPSQ